MQSLVTPTELYEAARETCIRLYVANGGDKRAKWSIQTYPGTASISCAMGKRGVPVWTLAMPAFPLDRKLPRFEARLIAAYTVHELLHALHTDFAVAEQARRLGIFRLLNCLEDNRIEFSASKGKLVNVSEARELLEMLNAYIFDKALKNPAFRLDAPEQFAFVLGLVIFAEKHGYRSAFPKDWRRHVERRMLPLFDLALAEFDGLASTADALALAIKLTDMAKALPPEAEEGEGQEGQEGQGQGQEGQGQGQGQGQEGQGEAEEAEGQGQGQEGQGEAEEAEGQGEGQEGQGEAEEAEGQGEGQEGQGEASKGQGEGQEGQGEGQEGQGDAGEGKGKPAKGSGEAGKAEGQGEANGKAPGNGASAGGPDLSDATQEYAEALEHLVGLGEQTSPEHYALGDALSSDDAKVTDNAFAPAGTDTVLGVSQRIASPAPLKRHLTSAVKSPERVGTDRHQLGGRLDLRNVVGLGTRRSDVYKRKIEEEGIEAAVSILLDASTSMSGPRIEATRAMALHMGDALKAAGVKFEVTAFSSTAGDRCLVMPVKQFGKPWNADTRGRAANIRVIAGTHMLPAITHCAKRLLEVRGVTRRILLVLTDGVDTYSAEANRFNVQRWRTKGVETVGLGLMTSQDSIRQSFDGRMVPVHSLEALSAKGLALLVSTLDAGAPKPEVY